MSNFDREVASEILGLAQGYKESPMFFGPVSEERIEAAERELGVKFPRSYRSFLRNFGAAKMLGYDFDGLPDTRNSDEAMPLYLHLVDNTIDYRLAWRDWPEHFVSVTDDGGECTYWIDTSIVSEDDESPIIACFAGRRIPVAVDFIEFVRLLTQESKLYEILSADDRETNIS